MQTAAKLILLFVLALCLAGPLGTAGGTGVLGTVSPPAEGLRETGFFENDDSNEPRRELFAYTPQYPLWSDGAAKRRWIELPPGTVIDAADADAWEFPPGTKLWKEFSLGRPIETRLIERLADGTWRYVTYVWNDAGTDASLAPPEGIRALPAGPAGSPYTIPSEYDCRACHEGGRVPVLGFSALQLSDERDPAAVHAEPAGAATVGLRKLTALGLLRNLPVKLIDEPPRIASRSPTERAALGYLHGNCGHCHGNADTNNAAVPVDARLIQEVMDPASTEHVLRSLIGAAGRFRASGTHAPAAPVVPGDAASSMVTMRMRSRDPRSQMPPLGTAIPDSTALALIERWINDELRHEEPKP